MTDEPASTAHRYQRWRGTLSQGRWTWLAIVVTGIRLALRGMRTRTLLLSASAVVVGSVIVLYILSLLEVMAGTREAAAFMEFISALLRVDLRGVAQVGEYREILWNLLFLLTIKAQMFWVLLVVSAVGPGLIAHDLKHGALPIYFAKPVTPLTYLAGKWLVVASFIAMVTVVPNLLTLGLGTMIAGGLHTWGQTLDLAMDLALSGATVCLAGGAIVLALSSLSSDHRYVTVAWLAVCLIPGIAQGIINDLLPPDSTVGWLGCVSLRHNVITLTNWLFGVREAIEAMSLPTTAFAQALVNPVSVPRATIVLAAWTVGGLLLSYRRIVGFSKSAANV